MSIDFDRVGAYTYKEVRIQMIKRNRSYSEGCVAIFEVANDTTRELYIGVTSLLSEILAGARQPRLPPKINHWSKEHRISYRCIERAIPQSDAWEFVKNYAQSSAMKGWKIV